jgi:hypothetical protein
MAASAAKFAHCHLRHRVEYRSKVPFLPSVPAPLDFAYRAGAILALDRELDRAILNSNDLRQLLVEDVAEQPGPGRAFDREGPRIALGGPRRPTLAGFGPLRRQFLTNQLNLCGDPARFRLPWTEASVRELHQTLLPGLGFAEPPGALRTQSYEAPATDTSPAFAVCPPERIGAELTALLRWVDRYGPAMMPVVPVAVLLQGFYAIRPFPYGSMTVARSLAVLYLRYLGLPNAEMVSLGSAVGSDPSLLRRLFLWTESTGSYGELVDHLTERTQTAYVTAADRWLVPGGSPHGFEEVALRILVRARRSPEWFSGADATRWVGGRGAQTVSRHLNHLVLKGVLESLGHTRAKRYRWVPPSRLTPALHRGVRGGAADSSGGKRAPSRPVAPPTP